MSQINRYSFSPSSPTNYYKEEIFSTKSKGITKKTKLQNKAKINIPQLRKRFEIVTPTIHLDLLLQGNKESINLLHSQLKDQGWAFVVLHSKLSDIVKKLKTPTLNFFDKQKKSDYSDIWRLKLNKGTFGLSRVNHKASLRLLSGSELVETIIPESIRTDMISLCQLFDETLIQLAKVLAEPFFGCKSIEELGEKGDFPLLKRTSKKPKFGMVDVAYYHNDIVEQKTIKEKGYPSANCEAHYDPGLLSLSILQTALGLQLRDKDNNWIDGPSPDQDNIGVIWAGHAANELSGGQIKAGIHQVVYPDIPGTPRMSIWAELCKTSQAIIAPSTRGSVVVKEDNFVVSNLLGDNEFVVRVHEGNVLDALMVVEKLKGIPFSKIIRRPVYNKQGDVVDVK